MLIVVVELALLVVTKQLAHVHRATCFWMENAMISMNVWIDHAIVQRFVKITRAVSCAIVLKV